MQPVIAVNGCMGREGKCRHEVRSGGAALRKDDRLRRCEGGRAHIKFDKTRGFHDGLGALTIFEQRIAQSGDTILEQAAKQAALFLCDPLAAAVLTDQNERKSR